MIFKSILKKNLIFKNSQLNKSCYIFGNGASIKSFNLKFFDNLPVFSCGWLFLHNDYHRLNVLCDFEIHPGIFFPIWKKHSTAFTRAGETRSLPHSIRNHVHTVSYQGECITRYLTKQPHNKTTYLRDTPLGQE